MTTRLSARVSTREDIQTMFHDYWNLYTALVSYASVLIQTQNLQGVEREAAEEINKLLVSLGQQTEAIRARVLALIG